MIQRLHEMYSIELRTKDKQLSEVTAEYEKYKHLNNLDRYFAKNLSDETRERVLENVKSLMVATDWHYFDPNEVEKLESANPTAILEKIIEIQENAQRKKGMEGGEIPIVPMTARTFGTYMDQCVEQNLIKPSIERTSDAANKFYT